MKPIPYHVLHRQRSSRQAFIDRHRLKGETAKRVIREGPNTDDILKAVYKAALIPPFAFHVGPGSPRNHRLKKGQRPRPNRLWGLLWDDTPEVGGRYVETAYYFEFPVIGS